MVESNTYNKNAVQNQSEVMEVIQRVLRALQLPPTESITEARDTIKSLLKGKPELNGLVEVLI